MDKKIRVAVVGMGGMGKCHSGNLAQLPEVELAALVSTHPDDTAAFMAEKGIACPVYTDFYKMIDEVALDAVYICLPPYGHNGQVEAAAAKFPGRENRRRLHGSAEKQRHPAPEET